LHKEKQREKNLILMYKATYEELFSLVEDLKKVIQLGWFRTPTNSSLSLLFKLGIEQIVVQDGSWILNKDDIKIWLSFDNGVDNNVVFPNVL